MGRQIVAKGIDISKWQAGRVVDFVKLKAEGYTFVIIRAGIGKELNQKDGNFEKYYAAAIAAGLDVGAYLYSYAVTIADSTQEAHCLLTWIAGKKLSMPVYFDLEDKSILAAGLTTGMHTAIAKNFMSIVEQHGYFVGLYANYNWLTYHLDAAALSAYTLWLAYWEPEATVLAHFKRDFAVWQYGSYDGMDADYAYVDFPSIIKRKGLNGFTSTETAEQIAAAQAAQAQAAAQAAQAAQEAEARRVAAAQAAQQAQAEAQRVAAAQAEAQRVAAAQAAEAKRIAALQFHKGDQVKVNAGAHDYTNQPLATFVYKVTYTVLEPPKGNRVVIGLKGAVTAAVAAENLTKV